jgi:hypothetical protein
MNAQPAPRHIVDDARLVQAAAWLHGRLRGQRDGTVRLPLDVRGRQDPASDVAIPDWPGPADGDESRELLRQFVAAGWLEETRDGGYRILPHERSLLAAMPLYRQVGVEAGRLGCVLFRPADVSSTRAAASARMCGTSTRWAPAS